MFEIQSTVNSPFYHSTFSIIFRHLQFKIMSVPFEIKSRSYPDAQCNTQNICMGTCFQDQQCSSVYVGRTVQTKNSKSMVHLNAFFKSNHNICWEKQKNSNFIKKSMFINFYYLTTAWRNTFQYIELKEMFIDDKLSRHTIKKTIRTYVVNTIFSLIYSREWLFSGINSIKSGLNNRLTDEWAMYFIKRY